LIGRFVPVVITSNSDAYKDLISRVHNDTIMAAVHRRWAFVRYFESWASAHAEVLDSMGKLALKFKSVYNNSSVQQ
jgi:hypothetical protein